MTTVLENLQAVIRPIEDYILPEDGDDNWQEAIKRAQDIHQENGTGHFLHSDFSLYFSARKYVCSKPVTLQTVIRLVGQPGASLDFPNGTGIVALNTNGDPTDSNPPNATFATIENLHLRGPGKNGPTGNGVTMFASLGLRNVDIVDFNGNGIEIRGYSNARPVTNSNAWSLRDCSIAHCTGNGIYVPPEDNQNAGMAHGVCINAVDGWGIYDNSFLGNTYVACGALNCGLGSFWAMNLDAGSLFIACSQTGCPDSAIHAPSQIFGGTVADHVTGNTGVTSTLDGPKLKFVHGVSARCGQARAHIGYTTNGYNALQLTGNVDSPSLYEIKYISPATVTPADAPLYLMRGWWMPQWANSDSPGPFAFSIGAQQVPPSGDSTMFWLPNGTYIGSGRARIKIITSNVPPKVSQGSLVLNSDVAPGQFAGWVPVDDGTGTLIWRGFGRLEKLPGD